jgi:hypothetical protein
MQNLNNLSSLNIGNLISEALNQKWSPAGEIVAEYAEKLTIDKAFNSSVGDFVYNHCKAVIRNKEIIIRTDHPVIKIELMLLKDEILHSINKKMQSQVLLKIKIYSSN